jgi:MFS transporter, OFA family, oxalate/formate antiporter
MTTPNRWLPVVGGVMLNMALGMFYGMSVFMLPLEKEFGWTRAQTSWVTTIGLALIAVWYVIAGFIQDRRGPRPAPAAASATSSRLRSDRNGFPTSAAWSSG